MLRGYITKKYTSQSLIADVEQKDDSEIVEGERNTDTLTPMELIVGHWYAFFLEKYQYWFIGIVLENQGEGQVKVDFLQQLSQSKNCFDSKDEVEIVPSASAFYEIECDPVPVSSTRINQLKLNDTEFESIIKRNNELFK